MIIAGGWHSPSATVSVEVFNPYTNHSCSLPDLPGEGRHWIVQCGRLICGGLSSSSESERSCLKLNPLTGVFTPTSVTLVEERLGHLCWDFEGEGGLNLLLGGIRSPRSTEMVTSYGLSSSANFSLQYDTR